MQHTFRWHTQPALSTAPCTLLPPRWEQPFTRVDDREYRSLYEANTGLRWGGIWMKSYHDMAFYVPKEKKRRNPLQQIIIMTVLPARSPFEDHHRSQTAFRKTGDGRNSYAAYSAYASLLYSIHCCERKEPQNTPWIVIISRAIKQGFSRISTSVRQNYHFFCTTTQKSLPVSLFCHL